MQSNFLPAQCLWSFVSILEEKKKEKLEISKDLALSVQMNSRVNLCDYFLAEPQRLCIWTVSSQMNEDFTLPSPYVFCFYHTGFCQISSDQSKFPGRVVVQGIFLLDENLD